MVLTLLCPSNPESCGCRSLPTEALVRIAESWGVRRGNADLVPHLVFAITDLRHAVAHNGDVFDTRFASATIRKKVAGMRSRVPARSISAVHRPPGHGPPHAPPRRARRRQREHPPLAASLSSLCRGAALATLRGGMNDTPERSSGEVVLYEPPAISSVHGEIAPFRDCVPSGVGLPRHVELHPPDWALLRKYATSP